MSGSGEVKGHFHRVLKPPGFHIRPQYDLVHTRHLMEERKRKRFHFSLSLAPMVDMFSILVIYLIMNFSTSGEAFFVNRQVKIPKASKGEPMKSFPLVTIQNGQVIFDMEVPGNKPLFIAEANDEAVPKLREMLRRVKSLQEKISQAQNSPPVSQINLQADESLSVDEVKKVLRVLIDEGWTGINFIVEPKGSES